MVSVPALYEPSLASMVFHTPDESSCRRQAAMLLFASVAVALMVAGVMVVRLEGVASIPLTVGPRTSAGADEVTKIVMDDAHAVPLLPFTLIAPVYVPTGFAPGTENEREMLA